MPQDRQVHHDYYLDVESAVEETEIDNTTDKASSSKRSSDKRVPSPPRRHRRREGHREAPRRSHRNARFIPPRTALKEPRVRSINSSGGSLPDYQQVPLYPIVPTLPFDFRRLSVDDRGLPNPRPLHPFYPRADTRYMAPLDGVHYSTSGGDWPPSFERRRSESIPSERVATPTRSTSQYWSNSSIPMVTSGSTIKSSLSSAPGVLGDRAYKYRALEDSEFRLVRVFPERKTMIKCEILHASIENPPRYVAISYAWGDARSTRKIELEGSLIPVAISLYNALEAVRQKVESLLVWVDALCIDQQNRDERTQQVRLMTCIYSTAQSVAIWLGPEEDDSASAIDLLRIVADEADSPEKVSHFLSSRVGKRELAAVVSLFEREYWRRLWVVQEISNARSITVFCGSTKLPWSVYQLASQAFSRHRRDLDCNFPGGQRDGTRHTASPDQFSYSQVLVYQGPGSLPDLTSYMELGEGALLEILRACRRKLASDARDKLFGILGVLPEEARNEFRADYSLSVKDVYTEIVDYLLKTTESIDVICDAIHFPVHTGSITLPSYVPDWSHVPQTGAIGHQYSFSAAGTTKASCRFLDERLNKLEISAIYLDTIRIHGIAVGTLCTLGDYLMAFLHWRALLLGAHQVQKDKSDLLVHEDFCSALTLGQIPEEWNKSQWVTICYHVFASLLRERLPDLPVDEQLWKYADAKVDIQPEARRQFLQKHFGDRMMGRCFYLTEGNMIGIGSGFMLPGDLVVVPLGCSTPILLRPEGTRGEYRFVGDVYVIRYMHGRAIDEWEDGKRNVRKFVLH